MMTMLALTREKLLEHLQEVNALVNRYQSRDSVFVAKSLNWLQEVEKSLLQIRSPAASLVAGERARLLAAGDGYRDPSLSDRTTSRRKAILAMTALVVSRVSDNLRGIIADIDAKFDPWRDKMAQLLALATESRPIPLPPTEPRHLWLQNVWRQLGRNGDTHRLFDYLNASMTMSDRLFLLDEMIERLLSESTGRPEEGNMSGGRCSMPPEHPD